MEVKVNQGPALLVGVIYRAPRLSYPSNLWASLRRFLPFYSNIIIMGDLNINLLNSSASESRRLIQEAQQLDLLIVPFSPTHHAPSSDSWIDHILISKHNKIKSTSQSFTAVSAHELLIVDLLLPNPKITPRSFEFRNFSEIDRATFLNDLSNYNWQAFYSSDSIDFKLEFFNNALLGTLDSHAPIRRIQAKRPASPWLNDHIRSLMKQRDCLRDKFRRSNDPFFKQEFIHFRNLVKKTLSSSRSAYFSALFRTCSDPKKTWNNVRSLGVGKAKVERKKLAVDINDLNAFFGQWGQSHLSNCPDADMANGQIKPRDLLTSSSDVPFNRGFGGGYSSPVSFDIPQIQFGVLKKYIGLSKSSSAGPDGITRRIIDLSFPISASLILHIFNYSIENEIYPTAWKDALICPIPKTQNPSSCNDYRPIALTSFLSKLLEKIVAVHAINFLESNNKFHPLQSSFRRFRSTQTALLRIHDDILWAAEGRMCTLMVLLDYSKAFDTVEHTLLLSKLRSQGFSGSCCNWIRSYLSGRRQRVVDGHGGRSGWVEMSRGVPQGTIFGPLFFICFTGDLPEALSHSKCMLFADDVQIYIHCKKEDLPSTISLINLDIQSISNWSAANHLFLNPSKTKAIIFASASLGKSIDLKSIQCVRVGDTDLEYSSSVKNLGVWLESDLSWVKHTNILAGRVYATLRQLRAAGSCLPLNLRIDLIRSLIFPHLDYCSLLLLGCPSYIDTRLRRLINLCIRFIFNLRGEVSISPLYIRLNWLLPVNRRLFFLGKLIYNLLQRKSPRYLSDQLVLKNQSSNRSSRRSSYDLVVPLARTDFGLYSFLASASNFWNSLPEGLRCSKSIFLFSKNLKDYLLERQRQEILSEYS